MPNTEVNVDPATELVTNVRAEIAPVAEPAEKLDQENLVKEKKAKVRKASAARAAAHPTHWRMIKGAIASLNGRTAASPCAIAKYLDDKYKSSLPADFCKTLSATLKNLTTSAKLTKVKYSFKLSKDLKKVPKANVPKAAKTVTTLKGPDASNSKEVKKTPAGRPKTVPKRKADNGLASLKTVKTAIKPPVKTTKGTKVNPAKATKEVKPAKLNPAKATKEVKAAKVNPAKATKEVKAAKASKEVKPAKASKEVKPAKASKPAKTPPKEKVSIRKKPAKRKPPAPIKSEVPAPKKARLNYPEQHTDIN